MVAGEGQIYTVLYVHNNLRIFFSVKKKKIFRLMVDKRPLVEEGPLIQNVSFLSGTS